MTIQEEIIIELDKYRDRFFNAIFMDTEQSIEVEECGRLVIDFIDETLEILKNEEFELTAIDFISKVFNHGSSII